MKPSAVILDYQLATRTILKDVIKSKYNPILVTNIEEISKQDIECILVHIDGSDSERTRMYLDKLVAIYGIDDYPIIAYADGIDTDVDDLIVDYKLASVVYAPFNPSVLLNTISNTIELYRFRHGLEKELTARTQSLKLSQKKLASNMQFVINALGSVVEFRDIESGQHVRRVAEITNVLMRWANRNISGCNYTEDQLNMISNAAAIHDLGKIAVSDFILNKPSKLTDEEYDEMKLHTVYGCQILEQFNILDTDNLDFYTYCHDICRWHHERIDGSGYPDNLAGSKIPIYVQVVSIADVIDALTSRRAYKEAYDTDLAYDMIHTGKCGLFSDTMLLAIDSCRDKIEDIIEKFKD